MIIYFFFLGLISVFALFEIWTNFNANSKFVWIVLFFLALFAGLRSEVGNDWPAYVEFFDNIDIKVSPFAQEGDNWKRFEVGYYLLNYFIKYIGFSCQLVFLVASFLLNYSLLKLLNVSMCKKLYVIAIYFGFSYLMLNFAQVRQSLAVAFILMSIVFLCTKKNMASVLLMMLSIVFHYSALIYILIILLSMLIKKASSAKLILLILMLLAISLLAGDFYSLFMQLNLGDYLNSKLEIYSETQVENSNVPKYIIASVILVITLLVNEKVSNENDLRSIQTRLVNINIISVVALFLSLFIFPSTYAFYSRVFSLSAILIAIVSGGFIQRSCVLFKMICTSLLLLSAYYYSKIILLYSEDYTPYKLNIDILN